LKAVFYAEIWKDFLIDLQKDILIPLEKYNYDKAGMKSLLEDLAGKKISEIIILDGCDVFNQKIKEDVFIINDHINATGDNPLIGPNDENMGVRFPDMTFPYSEKLSAEIKKLFKKKITFRETILYGAKKNPSKADMKKLIRLNCHISNFNIMWLDILARHAGIEVGAAVMKKGVRNSL